MNEALTPETILNDIASKKLSKAAAIDLLLSLIEKNEDSNMRARCIEIIGTLSLNDNKIFRMLENGLISDENAVMRSTAAKIMVKNFKKLCFVPLDFAITHDKSVIVLRTILDLLEELANYENGDPRVDVLKKKLLKKIELLYGVKKEPVLFLNLEVLHAKFTGNLEFKASVSFYKVLESLVKLPNTISLISRLNYLKLGGTELTPLSNTENSLQNLEKLFLNRT